MEDPKQLIPAILLVGFFCLPQIMNGVAAALAWLCPPLEKSGALYFMRWKKGWF